MVDDELLYRFFLGLAEGPQDKEGKLLISDILKFDENKIENKHNFIQWIFPTKEESECNPDARQISDRFKDLFLSNETAQENFCKSCKMFLNFVGFDCRNKDDNVITDIKSKKKYYDLPTHNLRRITRVLNSFNQIGKESCSRKLFAQLKKIRDENPKKVLESSFEFWEKTQ
jgi:hypothetical protein